MQQPNYQDYAEPQVIEQLEAILAEVGGGLAPFDPYLHWSLSRRNHFLGLKTVDVVRDYCAGLSVVRSQDHFYIARRFMNTNGWFWSCVPLLGAEADNRMLHTMMDGAA